MDRVAPAWSAEEPRIDEDLVALWIFALIGDSQWKLLQRYLDEWPPDYRPTAKA